MINHRLLRCHVAYVVVLEKGHLIILRLDTETFGKDKLMIYDLIFKVVYPSVGLFSFIRCWKQPAVDPNQIPTSQQHF